MALYSLVSSPIWIKLKRLNYHIKHWKEIHCNAKSIYLHSNPYELEWRPIVTPQDFIWCRTLFCSYNSFNSSRKRIQEGVLRDFSPFFQKDICEVKHWCWRWRPDSQSPVWFIPKLFCRVEIFHFHFVAELLTVDCEKFSGLPAQGASYHCATLAFTDDSLSSWERLIL